MSDNNTITLEHIPDLMAKCLSGINDEIDRVLAIATNNRKSSDVKSLLTCFKALAEVNKIKLMEEKQATMTINLLPAAELREIAAGSGRRAQKMLNAKNKPTIWEESHGQKITVPTEPNQ
jgi:hypothetical protein